MALTRVALTLALVAHGACLPAPGVRYPGLPTVEDGALHAIVFDVGQADAMLLIHKGRTLLVDCGSPLHEPSRAARAIPRRLDALLGHRHLDYFLVSHYHQDHLGAPANQANRRHPSGIFSLIDREGITIDTILDRGTFNLDAPSGTERNYEKAIGQWIADGKVRQRKTTRAGDLIDLGAGLRVEVVASSANGVLDRMLALYPQFLRDAPPSENDFSVAIKVTRGDFELFSAGDLSGVSVVRAFGPVRQSYTDVESPLADLVGALEVYRVNHHGSRHSTNPCFAKAMQPAVSIFSTGDNRYGHPDPAVYDRLKALGDVYITGGADPRYRAHVANDIVGGDVEVVVAPTGDRYWVNGRTYLSRSEEAEETLPGRTRTCRGPGDLAPDNYSEIEERGDAPGD